VVFVGRRLIERASPINTWNLRSSSVKPLMRFAPQGEHHKSKATATASEHGRSKSNCNSVGALYVPAYST
jgi:hypothetical protein